MVFDFVYAPEFIPDFDDFIQLRIPLMSVGHVPASRSSNNAQITPDLSRLKALGRPEGELPFDVCVLLLPLQRADQ
jgi:hypothetical protein